MAKDRTSPKTGTPSEKTKLLQKHILEQRKNGVSFSEIARQQDMTEPYIHKLYRKALKDIIEEDVKDFRKIELARLDEMQAKVMEVMNQIHPLVAQGRVVRDILEDENGQPVLDENQNPILVKLRDLTPILQAVDRGVKIMERRAKLLGLDAPTKTAMTDPTGEKEASYVQFYLPSNGREASEEAEEAGEEAGQAQEAE